MESPIGVHGIEFVEFASRDPEALHQLFLDFGFSRKSATPELNSLVHRLLERRACERSSSPFC